MSTEESAPAQHTCNTCFFICLFMWEYVRCKERVITC